MLPGWATILMCGLILFFFVMFVCLYFVGTIICGDYLLCCSRPRKWWGALEDGVLIRHFTENISRYHNVVGSRKHTGYIVGVVFVSLTIFTSAVFDFLRPDKFHYPGIRWYQQWWAYCEMVLSFLVLLLLCPFDLVTHDIERNVSKASLVMENNAAAGGGSGGAFNIGDMVIVTKANKQGAMTEYYGSVINNNEDGTYAIKYDNERNDQLCCSMFGFVKCVRALFCCGCFGSCDLRQCSGSAHNWGCFFFMGANPGIIIIDYSYRYFGKEDRHCFKYLIVLGFACLALICGLSFLVLSLRKPKGERVAYDESDEDIEAKGDLAVNHDNLSCYTLHGLVHDEHDLPKKNGHRLQFRTRPEGEEYQPKIKSEEDYEHWRNKLIDTLAYNEHEKSEVQFQMARYQTWHLMQFFTEATGIALVTSLNVVCILEKVFRQHLCYDVIHDANNGKIAYQHGIGGFVTLFFFLMLCCSFYGCFYKLSSQLDNKDDHGRVLDFGPPYPLGSNLKEETAAPDPRVASSQGTST